MKNKLLLIFGTRPEAIKMCPLALYLSATSSTFDVKVCVTAQHRHMLDQVLEEFDVVPDFDLDLMHQGQSLSSLTAQIIESVSSVLEEWCPDLVLVHGDTTTTFGASVAAFYKNIQVGHVEAGLRTHNLAAPFPEEFNRQVTSKLASIHFAPTSTSKDNLLSEGIACSSIFITGNTVIDALFLTLKRIEDNVQTKNLLIDEINQQCSFDWRTQKFVLITGHRRENFGSGFLSICNGIAALARNNPNVKFVYPVHLNPNVQQPVNELLAGLDNVYLISPLGYRPFIYLLNHSFLVLTDSGGIQEEAPGLGKPVLVMRDTTERPEAVSAGTVSLVGADERNIIRGVQNLLDDATLYSKMSKAHNPYGDGTACRQISETINLLFKRSLEIKK